jgi:hypothetical protein
MTCHLCGCERSNGWKSNVDFVCEECYDALVDYVDEEEY